MSESWHSYPSIFNVGHRALEGFFDGPVLVQEKVDGSQFSFGSFGGELRCRSKGQQLVVTAPEKMFTLAVETAVGLFEAGKLVDGWTYRGEYLQKPTHNTLTYGRIPAQHVILFDINDGHESYLLYSAVANEAARLGLDVVPLMFEGWIKTPEQFKEYLERDSVLGGTKVEGVVAKRYDLFGQDKKCLMAKYVCEGFKELNSKAFRIANPTRGDVVEKMIGLYKTEARWQKAVQHLREAGTLQGAPQDIGALMKEVHADIEKECAADIAETLMKWALPQIKRAVVGGLPQWYKDRLLTQQFQGNDVPQDAGQ